jgi:Mg-chelatase subunit ChlD
MQKKNSKQVHNLIIVDESGSMSIIHKQAFTGMNETLQTIRQMQEKYPDQKQYVTLLTFDTGHTKWHYDNTPAEKTQDLGWKDYNPGGGTPLYDAIGKGISKVNANVTEGDHVLVTIITDGEENSSEEWTLKMVRNMIEKLKSQNWTFTLIGTDNLDVESMAHSFAIDEHLAFKEDEDGTHSMFEKERRSRERFNCCIASEAAIPKGKFFDED